MYESLVTSFKLLQNIQEQSCCSQIYTLADRDTVLWA